MREMKFVVQLSVVAGAALLLAGCSIGGSGTADQTQRPEASSSASSSSSSSTDDQSAALDDYVERIQPQIETLKAQSTDTYTDIALTAVHPGSLSYEYWYSDQVEAEATGAYLDDNLDTFQTSLDDQVFPEMRQNGITEDLGAVYTYYNLDGSLVWTHTFTATE